MKFPSLPTINFGSVGKPELIPAELSKYIRSHLIPYFSSSVSSNILLFYFILFYFLYCPFNLRLIYSTLSFCYVVHVAAGQSRSKSANTPQIVAALIKRVSHLLRSDFILYKHFNWRLSLTPIWETKTLHLLNIVSFLLYNQSWLQKL